MKMQKSWTGLVVSISSLAGAIGFYILGDKVSSMTLLGIFLGSVSPQPFRKKKEPLIEEEIKIDA